MAVPQTVEELKDFEAYRTFLRACLKQVTAEPIPLFISKDRFDFDLKGKPWAGRAVLLGDPKGAACVKKLKALGLAFRDGTCRLEGADLRVEGLSPKLVKDAAKTFQKLLLGCTLIPPEGAEEDDADDEGASGAAAPGGESAEARWKTLKAELTPEVKAAIGRSPEIKERALALLGTSAQQEKQKDWDGAIATFAGLRALIGVLGASAPDVQVYRQGLLAWDTALQAVEREMAKLKKSVVDTYSKDPAQGDPKKGVQKLNDVTKKLDNGLRAKLEQAAAAKDAAARAKVQADVDALLKKIAASLGKDPMIKSLDANPFITTSIRQTMADALKQISASLRG